MTNQSYNCAKNKKYQTRMNEKSLPWIYALKVFHPVPIKLKIKEVKTKLLDLCTVFIIIDLTYFLINLLESAM